MFHMQEESSAGFSFKAATKFAVSFRRKSTQISALALEGSNETGLRIESKKGRHENAYPQ